MTLNVFMNATTSGGVAYRAEQAPFWSIATEGEPITLNVPGTPPFQVHSSMYDSERRAQMTAWQHLPGNLSTNAFTWTPVIQAGANDRPTLEGNETDYRPAFQVGDSVIWVFQEMLGDFRDPDVENAVRVSGNFTVMTPEQADEAESDYEEYDESWGVPSAGVSLKGVLAAGLVAMAMISST